MTFRFLKQTTRFSAALFFALLASGITLLSSFAARAEEGITIPAPAEDVVPGHEATETAVYETVGSGRTGHAESVQVTFDPKKISYGKILQIYFSVAHDPTQLNRQGPDRGTQYRSAIFPTNEKQAEVAKAYIAQLDQAKMFHSKIVTKIEPGHEFYPAEGYHQDFLVLHPNYPYIVFNDLPKVRNLKRLFPDLYREKPALVSEAKS